MKITILLCLCISLQSCWLSESEQNKSSDLTESSIIDLHVYAVQINVTNIDSALDFYTNKIGFEIDSKSSKMAKLKNDGIALILNQVSQQRNIKYGEESQTILVLQTNNLDSVVNGFKEEGIHFIEEKTENGVGFSAKFEDPFGNIHSILEQSKFPVPQFKEPKIYNVGYYLPNIEKAKEFYCKNLGFSVRSTKYLPALPLNHHDSTFAFMLHERDVQPTELLPNNIQTMIVFSAENIDFTINSLKMKGITVNPASEKSPDGRESYYIIDPFGNLSKLIGKEMETVPNNK